MPADGYRQRCRVRALMLSAVLAWPRDSSVVAMSRLVIDHCDRACCFRTERILGGGVGVASRSEGFDVGGLPIRAALDLVKIPVVGGEQRSHCAMCGDTRRTVGSINVAGQRPGCQRWCGRN